MSLINEALKKAQKMRHESPQADSAPQAPTPAPVSLPAQAMAPRTSAERQGFSGTSVALIAGGAGLLACVCILATVYIVRKPAAAASEAAPESSSAPVVQAPTAPVQPSVQPVAQVTTPPAAQPAAQQAIVPAQASTPAPQTPAAIPVVPPRRVEPSVSNDGPVISLPSVMTARPASAPQTEASQQPSAPAPAPAPVPPVASTSAARPAAAPAQPQPQPESSPLRPAPLATQEQPMIQLPVSVGGPAPAPAPRTEVSLETAIQKWVNDIRIGGMRPGIKVLLNNRAYRPGDLVESTLGVRLLEIGGDHLVFADAAGRHYLRNF